MQYTFENIDELIAKRFAGEIGEAEDAILDRWLSASEANQQYFGQMQRLWQKAAFAQGVLSRPLDVDAALARTKSKIQQIPAQGKAKKVFMNPWWIGIAASIMLLAAAIWFFQGSSSETPVLLATIENTVRDTLSDGSRVALNQHSSLSTEFSKKQRRIKMRGEAYFDVAKNPEKPFVIEVQKVEVTVVGTRFNVDNRSDSTKVVVSVEEGRVKVQIGRQIEFLNAGEQATIDCSSGEILRSQLLPSGNVKAWFDRRFVFDDVPLSEVIPILEKTYNVQIELKNKDLGTCRLHTRFNNESIERIMSLIAETFSLQIESNNGRFSLDGAGCG
ncbi:MAG: FecR domain-containing protein [Saprospiraceae bacterium]|nr:FecR domain-containing protein [Saprospiraceae bacterium]